MIVESYDTRVTLRQLFCRLVAAALSLNIDSHYKTLSRLTAQGHRNAASRSKMMDGELVHSMYRDGSFPELMDTTRSIEEYSWHASAPSRATPRRAAATLASWSIRGVAVMWISRRSNSTNLRKIYMFYLWNPRFKFKA